MRRRIIVSLHRFLLVWAAIVLTLRPGKLSADSIVVVGAGTVGSWDTEVELANPTAAELLVQVGANPVFEGGCPMQCPFTSVILPPKGSAKLRAAEIFHTIQDGLFAMYVRVESGVTLPTVRARVADAAAPSQAVELPAVRLSTIAPFDGGALIFPSVRRTTTGHSNLILTNLDLNGSMSADIEVYAPNGDRLGGTSVSVEPGVVVFLVDVLATLGITSLDDGQILISRTSAIGIPWGEVATVDSVNGVFVSIGRNP